MQSHAKRGLVFRDSTESFQEAMECDLFNAAVLQRFLPSSVPGPSYESPTLLLSLTGVTLPPPRILPVRSTALDSLRTHLADKQMVAAIKAMLRLPLLNSNNFNYLLNLGPTHEGKCPMCTRTLDEVIPAKTVGTLNAAEAAGGIKQQVKLKSFKVRRARSDLQGSSCYRQSCCQSRDSCRCSTQQEWARDLGYFCKYNFKDTTMFQNITNDRNCSSTWSD
jgi:hypothetical protein